MQSIFHRSGLKTGYWQIEVNEMNREKTAFIMPDGLQVQGHAARTLLGTCNVPARDEHSLARLEVADLFRVLR